MSEEAPSDEIISQETLTQRNNFEPRFLSIRRDGRIILPTGTILDALRGTILFNGAFLDNLPKGNIVQGQTTGDTVLGTNTENSTVISSNDTIIGNGDVSGLVVIGSQLNDVSGEITGLLIAASDNSTVAPSTFDFSSSSGLNAWTSAIIASAGCTLTGQIHHSSITGCNGCELEAVGTVQDSHRVYTSGIYNSTNSVIRSVTGQAWNSSIIASTGCTLENTTTFSLRRAIIGCIDSQISQGGNLIAVAGDNINLTGTCFNVLASGLNSTVTGHDNVFCFGGTSTGDNQAMLGVDLQVSGAGNNITTNEGFVQTERGLVQNYREPGTLPDTLLATDYHVHMPVTGGTFTLPLAATLGAAFPLGTTREFQLTSPPTPFPTVVATTAPDVFSQKSGWTQHTLELTRGHLTLKLVNSLVPYWSISDSVTYYAFTESTTDNNFGVTPPQVDASILPTSTDQASHQALGAASYYTLETIQNNNAQTFTLGAPGITINTIGGYEFTYQIDVQTDTGAGNYIIRSDIVNTTTGTPVTGTYQVTGGRNNNASGSKHIHVTSGLVTVPGSSTFQLRLSQDAAETISNAANITRVSLKIEGNI